MNIEQQHAAFEAACAQWAEDVGRDDSDLCMARDEDGYIDKHIQALLGVWQAAIELDRQGRGEPCNHRIADIRNAVVKSGYMCMDCGGLFSAADHDAVPQPAEPPAALMRLMPEVLASLKGSGQDVSLAADVERALSAQPADPGNSSPVDWQDAERIADLPEVDELLAGFAEDPTGDAGTMIVRAVMQAVRQQVEPVKVSSDRDALPAFISHAKRLYTGDPKDHKDWPAFKAGFEAAQPAPGPSDDDLIRAALARDTRPAASAEPVELQGIAEALENGDGLWRSCTGCHELNEGHDTGPYSETLKCHLGSGCSECGGIGAIWDTTDYQAMADEMAEPVAAQPSVPGWISIKEQLPEIIEAAPGSGTGTSLPVLVYLSDEGEEAGGSRVDVWRHFRGGRGDTTSTYWDWDSPAVTHWMQLPPPPADKDSQ